MLAAEKVRTQRGSGEIHFYQNRYWAPELNAIAGDQVVVRFDPEHLHAGIRVYDTDDRFICDAPCKHDVGFYDVTAAREHARDEAALLKIRREELRLVAKHKAETLARLYSAVSPTGVKEPAAPKVKRLPTGAKKPIINIENPSNEHSVNFEDSFSKGLRMIKGGRD